MECALGESRMRERASGYGKRGYRIKRYSSRISFALRGDHFSGPSQCQTDGVVFMMAINHVSFTTF